MDFDNTDEELKKLLGQVTVKGAEKGLGYLIKAAGAKVILIIVLVIIICLVLLAAVMSIFSSLSNISIGLTSNNEEDFDPLVINDTKYVLDKIEDGSLDVSSSTGMLQEDDFKFVLEEVYQEEQKKTDTIEATYEQQRYVKVADDYVPPKKQVRKEVVSYSEEMLNKMPASEVKKLKEQMEKSKDDSNEDNYDYVDAEIIYENDYGKWKQLTDEPETIDYLIRRKDIGEINDGVDPYMVRWQPIVAAVMYREQNNGGQWGTFEGSADSDDEDSEDSESFFTKIFKKKGYNSYFISKNMITQCINIYEYSFNYYYNPFEDGKILNISRDTEYKLSEDDYAYFLVEERVEGVEEGTEVTYAKMPTVAPRTITNALEEITFVLDEDGVIRTKEIKKTPHRFIAKLESAVGGSLDITEYLFMLRMLPECEDIALLVEEQIELTEQYESDEDIPIEVVDLAMPIYVPTASGYIGSPMIDGDSFQIWVSSIECADHLHRDVVKYHKADCWVTFDADSVNKKFVITDPNERMSLDEINRIIAANPKYFGGIQGCGYGIYKAQQENNVSPLAALAILMVEGRGRGNYGGSTHERNYNYYDIIAKSGKPSYTISTGNWYSAKENAINVFNEHPEIMAEHMAETGDYEMALRSYCLWDGAVDFIAKRYVPSGRDCFFSMSWCYQPSKGNYVPVQPGEEVDSKKLSGCFCPWWDEEPVHKAGGNWREVFEINPNGGGWVNGAIGNQKMLEAQLRALRGA